MLDRNGPIHKTRIVYNSNVNTVTLDTNIYCSRPTWTLWLAPANALHTTCDSRSYAQVLKQGKAIVRTEQLNEKVQPVEKQQFTASFSQPKNIRKTQKSSQKRDNIQDTRVFTQTVSQRHLIPTSTVFKSCNTICKGLNMIGTLWTTLLWAIKTKLGNHWDSPILMSNNKMGGKMQVSRHWIHVLCKILSISRAIKTEMGPNWVICTQQRRIKII